MRHSKLLFLLLLIWIVKVNEKIYSQNDSIKLHLKDYHSAQITDILVTKNKKRIITIDNSGKIIVFNAEDFSYNRTVKKSDGFLISNPRLINNDNLLLFQSKDTVWSLDVKGKIVSRKPFQGSLINNKKKGPFIFKEKLDFWNSSLYIYDEKFKFIRSLKANNSVRSANITKDNKSIAFIEYNNIKNQKLIYKSLENDNLIWEYEEGDNHKLIYPFFDEEKNNVFAFTVSTEKKVLSIYTFNNGAREKKPIIAVPWFSTHHTTFIEDNLYVNNQFIITDKGTSPHNLVIISFINNKFTSKVIKIKEGAYSGAFLNDKKIITSDVFYDGNSIAKFTVSNIPNGEKINSYPGFSRKFYEGIYLPDDSFLVQGTELKKSTFLSSNDLQVKYYNKGTFYNRFNKLTFKNYLEINHKIFFDSNNYFFDKTTGVLIFRGSEVKGDVRYIFKYNFIDDKVTKLYKIKGANFGVVDYDNSTNKLLLSTKNGYKDGVYVFSLAIVENNKLKELEGLYKSAKISRGANYILTLNAKNYIEIRSNLETIIFQEKLIADEHIIHKANYGFIISYKYFSNKSFLVENETILFLPKEKNIFETEKKANIYITAIDYRNNKTAVAIENIGVIIDNKRIEKDYLESVKSVSFNKDASKLMISYTNGKISILNTETVKEIGAMFHPSEKEHIFYDTNNHYFSNTNSENFLFATINDKKVAIQNLDIDIFKPEKVLKVFGKPNQEYLKLLKKATLLRNNNQSVTEIKLNGGIKTSNKKGDLYVLSVGVSKYKDSKYNLTFADKDAFDIASVYGKLDSITIKNFKDKFLGKKYTLQSSEKKQIASLNRYMEYNSIGEMYALSFDNKIWLEINYDKAFLWDFNKNKIEKISLPKDFTKDDFFKQVFKSPHQNVFYLRTINNNFYKINYVSKITERIMLPFEFNYNDYKNYKPIEDDKWIYPSRLNNQTNFQILSAYENKASIDTVVYQLDKYVYKTDTIQIESYDNLNPNFKSISSSGNYILFTDVYNNAYRVKLSKNEIPLKLPFPIEYSNDASISEDGSKITVLNKYSDNFRYKSKTYNLKGEVLDSLTFIDKNYSIKGISILNAKPIWVKTAPSLIKDFNYSSFSSFKTLSNSKPFSFKNTFVKKITNEEATKEKIEKEISSFLKNTKEEDQVIIFFAGHGVLDKDNNYHYAPHNMDFKNVTKKGVAFKTIVEGLSNTKATNKLLLMDTCHAGNTLDIEGVTENESTNSVGGKRGTITKTNKRTPKFKMSEIVGSLFDNFLSKSGITILSASSGGDVAYENKELSNGAFTSAYLKILKGKMDIYGVTEDGIKKTIPLTEDFISEVFKEVMILTNGKQVPDIREINKNVVIKVW